LVLKRQKGRFERWIVHFQHWILTKGLVENKTRSDKERGRQHLSTCKHVHFQADLGKSHAAGCAAHPIHRFAFLLLLLLPTPLLLLQRVYTRTRAELCDYKKEERSYSSSSSSSARSAPGPIKPRITRAVKSLPCRGRRGKLQSTAEEITAGSAGTGPLPHILKRQRPGICQIKAPCPSICYIKSLWRLLFENLYHDVFFF